MSFDPAVIMHGVRGVGLLVLDKTIYGRLPCPEMMGAGLHAVLLQGRLHPSHRISLGGRKIRLA
jgi:hypothetical protein